MSAWHGLVAPIMIALGVIMVSTGCSQAARPPAAPAIPASEAYVEPESGERHLRSIRQLTFGGNNAEAYFSPDGKRLIFQRQDSVSSGCDQQYVMSTKTFSNQRGLRASQPLDASFPVPPSCPGAAVRGRLRRVFGSP